MAALIQIVDAALADAARRAGPHLVCHPGCSPCCTGVFAISQQDAARLREGLLLLHSADPLRAERVHRRVAASLVRLHPSFPGDPATGILAQDDAAAAAFEDLANDELCPVLDPGAGTCDLYAHRPILCRVFGPPARTAEGDLAHCELCFAHATSAQIVESELDPALPRLEHESNAAFDAAHHVAGETLIAYALRP